MKRLITAIYVLFLFVFVALPANAEMEKIAIACAQEELCFYWWPKLPYVPGWHHELEFSYKYSSNAQAPDGYTFANAESVIYAKALYKPRIPETTSLEMLINDDKQHFLSSDQNIIYTEVDPLITGDGQILKSFTFSPKEKGNWEQLSYGEEDDFYLIFTVSSRTKEGFIKALRDYNKFINQYKKNP